MSQQQYYLQVQGLQNNINVEDLKHINLENCVVVNEDGTPYNSRQVLIEPNQVIENNQLPQIIYQNAQNIIQMPDGQIQYLLHEDDLQSDNYNLVQPGTQQVYIQKFSDNGQHILQQVKGPADMPNTIEVQQTSPVQYQTVTNQQQVQQQPYQQIVIQNYPQSPQVLQTQQQQQPNCVIRQSPQMQNTTYMFQQQQIQTSPTQQLVQVQAQIQPHQQSPIGSTMQEIQTTPQMHGNRIQLVQGVQQPQLIRKAFPSDIGVRPRFGQRILNQNHIQMTTPQKVMQPPGMQQPIRYQTPVRATRPPNPIVRAVRPRTQTPRVRAPNTIRATINVSQQQQQQHHQQQLVTSVAQGISTQGQRIVMNRLTNPNQIQPIISVGTPKHVTTMTSTPRFRAQVPSTLNKSISKTVTLVHVAPTSNTNTSTEDLEDSIQAARITKQPAVQQTEGYTIAQTNQVMQQQIHETNDNRIVTLQSGVQRTVTEYKARPVTQAVTPKHVVGIKPINRQMVQNRPARFVAPNVARVQRPVLNQQTQHVTAQQIMNTEQQQPQYVIEEEVRDSARMLIVLENGEQRLITFTLPKESCTVQELLEQIGVPFEHDTTINCMSKPGQNIDYLVTVGVNLTETPSEIITAAENSLQLKNNTEQQSYQNVQQPMQVVQNHVQQAKIVQKTPNQQLQQLQKVQTQMKNSVTITQKSSNPTNVQPKFVFGLYALCYASGYTSQNHAQCQRCFRIFTEETKKIPISNASTPSQQKVKTTITTPTAKAMTLIDKQKKDGLEQIQKKFIVSSESIKTPVRVRMPVPRTQVAKRSKKVEEPVILTLSSDEEDEETSVSKESDQGEKLLAIEPICKDNIQPDDFIREDVCDLKDSNEKLVTTFKADKVYLGTYIFTPAEEVYVTSKGVRLVVPNCKNPTNKVALNIQKSEIMKVLCNFEQKSVIILYVLNTCGRYVRENLEMSADSGGGYFSPMSTTVAETRIFIEADMNDANKAVIKSILSTNALEEISLGDTMIMRNQIRSAVGSITSGNDSIKSEITDGVCNILIYPPTGKGGIPINTKDFICLGIDQYLNDVIIDFYLKYVHDEILTEAQRAKTHIFSTFFYNTLTNTKLLGTSTDVVKLTAAQKRHDRVKNWTKKVNIFEKDFMIVPINQQSHWFLAIICFPSLKGAVTIDSNQPVKAQPVVKKKPAGEKKESVALQIGNTTITPVSKKDFDSICLDEESERDEAEGEESDLESDDSETETTEPQPTIQPTKQPCILLFDSLAGASRNRVVATLRDYLTCEYRAKIKGGTDHTFDRFNIQGHSVKVPQQTNFTDCGLYLLQYVESFFTDPIKSYRIPIKQLVNWFEAIDVTKKREDIVNLIKRLMEQNKKFVQLPEIQLPTENGKLLELPDFLEEHGEFEEEEELETEYTEEAQPQIQPSQPPQPITSSDSAQKKRMFIRTQTNISANDGAVNNGEGSTKKRRT